MTREERREERREDAAGGEIFRVLLCDDHRVILGPLARELSLEDDLEVVGQARDGRMAVELARELAPDVVVMDLQMPVMGGLEAMARIRKEDPDAKVLVMTGSAERSNVEAALREGAAGYIMKDVTAEDFARAIREVARGYRIIGPGANAVLSQTKPWDTYGEEREVKILLMLHGGASTAEIAPELNLSVRTIKADLTRMFRDFGAKNRTELVARALEEGVLRP